MKKCIPRRKASEILRTVRKSTTIEFFARRYTLDNADRMEEFSDRFEEWVEAHPSTVMEEQSDELEGCIKATCGKLWQKYHIGFLKKRGCEENVFDCKLPTTKLHIITECN